ETANKRESSICVALAIHLAIQSYIFNIEKYSGMALMIEFHFSRRNKIRIIAVYILSIATKQLNKAQVLITRWINEANARQINLVIMGDFNNNLCRKNIPENHLLYYFQDSGLTSLLDFYDITEPTWLCKKNSWSTIVKAAADKFISATYTQPFKATRLHQALKLSNKIQAILKQKQPPISLESIIVEINGLLKRIHTFSDLEYQTLEIQNIYTNKFAATSMELKQI
ncbi:11711_t:CDS:2, partial [Gigaspora margarita]